MVHFYYFYFSICSTLSQSLSVWCFNFTPSLLIWFSRVSVYVCVWYEESLFDRFFSGPSGKWGYPIQSLLVLGFYFSSTFHWQNRLCFALLRHSIQCWSFLFVCFLLFIY